MASKTTHIKTKTQAKADVADKRRRRRKGKNTLYYFLALFVCMAAGIILSFTVFFRLDNIVVVGNTMYSNEDIIATSQIRLGDNMFRIVEADVNQLVTAKFPFVEYIKIKRKLPTSLSIDVTMSQPAAVLPTESSALLVTSDGRVLECGKLSDYPQFSRLEGFVAPSLNVMDRLNEEQQKTLDIALNISNEIKKAGLENIKIINFSDISNVTLLYDDRLIIKLGSLQELSYKLEFATYTIKNSIEATFVGVMDVSIPPYARVRSQNIYTEEIWYFSNEYLQEIMPFVILPNQEEIPPEIMS